MPDTNDKIKLHVVDDNLVPTPSDKAEVRVIQASPDAGEVDIVAKQGNKKLFSGVNLGSDTRYMEVDPTTSTLEVHHEGKDNVLASTPNAKFDKGKIHTLKTTASSNFLPLVAGLSSRNSIGKKQGPESPPSHGQGRWLYLTALPHTSSEIEWPTK